MYSFTVTLISRETCLELNFIRIFWNRKVLFGEVNRLNNLEDNQMASRKNLNISTARMAVQWKSVPSCQARKTIKSCDNRNQTSIMKLLKYNLVPGGFMPFWIQYYYEDNPKKFFKKQWKFFVFFHVAILFRIIKILSLYQEENYSALRWHVYLGTFAQYLGGPLHYTELIGFFWSFTSSFMYCLCICRPREEFDWLKIFVFLSNQSIF